MTDEISTPEEVLQDDTFEAETETINNSPQVEVDKPDEDTETAEIQNEDNKDNGLLAGKYKTVDELVKGYKEAEAYISKVAELESKLKELEPKQPQIVDENGQIDKNFELRYKAGIDNQEFSVYEQLSRGLDLETRQEVETLLNKARDLYNPSDTRAYEAAMAEVKQYFDTGIIEKIAQNKLLAQNAMSEEFQRAKFQQRYNNGSNLCKLIEENEPELLNLLSEKSESYIPELFQVFKDTFETHGQVDIKTFKATVEKVKEIGVRDYLAKQQIEKTKENAIVPSGSLSNVQEKSIPTPEQLINMNQEDYNRAVEKYGLETIFK